MNKERQRVRQVSVEFRNTQKRIGHLERKGKAVPVELFSRVRELQFARLKI